MKTPENFIDSITLPSAYKRIYSGKVREIFEHEAYPGRLFIIATDRLSTLDVVHKSMISGKGEVQTQIASFRFEYFKSHKITKSIPTHIVDKASFPSDFPIEFHSRTMIVKKLLPIPIEAIVRGYFYGTAVKEYEQRGTIAGISMKKDLVTGSQFAEPLFAPSTKALKGQHDENIDFETMVNVIGLCLTRYGMSTRKARHYAKLMQEYSLTLYKTAASYTLQRGIILADTKFEFGFDHDGKLCVMDEVITPDSSRFWKAEGYEPGVVPLAFDKQALKSETAKIRLEKKEGNIPLLFSEKILQETIDSYRTVASLLLPKT